MHIHTNTRPPGSNRTRTFNNQPGNGLNFETPEKRERTAKRKTVMLRVRRRASQPPVEELHVCDGRSGQKIVKNNSTTAGGRRVFKMVRTVKWPNSVHREYANDVEEDAGRRGIKRSAHAVKRKIDPIEEAFDPGMNQAREGAKIRKTVPIVDCKCVFVSVSVRLGRLEEALEAYLSQQCTVV